MAVSKTFPLDAVRAARDAGLTRFGENRLQEALPKIAALPDLEWHLVGHLQSNKARQASAAFAMIHSVDSLALLGRLTEIARGAEDGPALLLQVNVGGEASKSGFEPAWFAEQSSAASTELTRAIVAARRVRGLMTIAPLGADPRPSFSRLRRLRDALQQTLGTALPHLSMGMSTDVEVAVEEGATLVRIGTALFGPRPV